MLKKTAKIIYITYFLFFSLFFGFKIFQLKLPWQTYLGVLWWLSGAYIGYWLLLLDRLVDVYFTHPQTKMSLYIKDLIFKKNYKQVILDLGKYGDFQKNLSLRSVFFQVIWVPLTLFTLTSTYSLLGKALVVGLGFRLLLDEWEDFTSGRGFSYLFWQIRREITQKEQKIYLWVMTGIFLVFTLMLL